MDFFVAMAKVLVGAFVLFTVARITCVPLSRKSVWVWVGFVAMLAVANMLVHRLIGSTINPPFYTALLLAISLAGLTPKEAPQVEPWFRRAILGVVAGTIVGWAFYVEVGTVR